MRGRGTFGLEELYAEPVPDGLDYESLGMGRPAGPLHHGPAEVSALVPHQRLLTGLRLRLGIHHIDIAQWATGTELTGPVRSKALPASRMTMCSAITRSVGTLA